MQTKQLKQCTRNVHPSFADFRPGLGVNFHILLTQNWLWESSLSLLSLWCILFQIKLGLFRENLNLKKHLGPKNGWSSPSTFWHRLIYIYIDIYTDCIIMQADGIVAHFQHFQAKHYPASKLSTSTTSTSIVLIIIFY